MANPDVQSMGRARFCKTTFTKQQTCTNSPTGNSFWKSEIPRKGPPLQDRILTQCKSSYDLFKIVQFQEVKGLPSNMPASYHWEPPASTLAHCLAVIHPNQDVLAKGCLACRRQNNAICKTPSTSPTPGQRCADWTTRPPKWRKPDVQSMGRARFCKTTFTKQQTCTNSPKGNSFWKSEIPRKGPPLQDRILTQCKSSYDLFKHVMSSFKKWKASPPTCQPVTTGNPQRAP